MPTPPTSVKKLAMFTDIHFGKRGNSRLHNQDCLDFIDWFCAQVRSNSLLAGTTHVAFLGDWFESRSAINVETLDYSYAGLKKLNALGLPVFFLVGNHDLHRRTTRDVHSVRMFNEMSNFTVIDHVQVIDNLLFAPYLFHHEYDNLVQHNDLWAFIGHFEFQDFLITGYNMVLEHGPRHSLFPGPKKLFSGHFHKRQSKDNVCYIGNAFPMDFGDAGDVHRGLAVYETATDDVRFVDWSDCPKYAKTTLSKMLKGDFQPASKLKVKCIVDAELSYTEAQTLREAMVEQYGLRDFILEEDREAKQGLVEGDTMKVAAELDFSSVEELVVSQLETLKGEKNLKHDVDLLVSMFKDLPVEYADGVAEE